MKKIIAVNAGPRKGWNTDRLIKAAAKGAEDSGAEVKYVDLFSLERYTGCISCFACKRGGSYGRCACIDGLTEVLDEIRNADGLIIGSPNYLGNMTASFRALYERLVFQSLTYNKEKPNCNTHMIPVIFITTSNYPEEAYDLNGYGALISEYRRYLSSYVGPTEVLVCGNTLQVNDYSRYDWTIFDPAEKKKHHDETFDSYLKKAYDMGKRI